MPDTRLAFLFHAWFDKTATPLEEQELMALLRMDANDPALQALLEQAWEMLIEDEMVLTDGQQQAILQEVLRKGRRTRSLLFRSAAAVLILLLGTGVWWLFHLPARNVPAPVAGAQQNDIAPGGDKAMLTLSDGTKIVLDSAANGLLARQGNVHVTKLKDGQLAYTNLPGEPGGQLTYNTMTTPRGGQYQLVLPDGSIVWLNAASSIRYPTTFMGQERRVTITGEAYFEVKKNASMPFKVQTNDGTLVEVMGTSFDINTYSDEPLAKVTLLDGKVGVHSGSIHATSASVLLPGQQASISHTGEVSLHTGIDTDEVMAWKNGLFQFNNADIGTVMRQIARWYDVEVSYEGNIPDAKFWGKLPREANASQVLRVLQKTGVHFRIEGKKDRCNELVLTRNRFVARRSGGMFRLLYNIQSL